MEKHNMATNSNLPKIDRCRVGTQKSPVSSINEEVAKMKKLLVKLRVEVEAKMNEAQYSTEWKTYGELYDINEKMQAVIDHCSGEAQ